MSYDFTVKDGAGEQYDRAVFIQFYNPYQTTGSISFEIETLTKTAGGGHVVVPHSTIDFVAPVTDEERARPITLYLEDGTAVGTKTAGEVSDTARLFINSLMIDAANLE